MEVTRTVKRRAIKAIATHHKTTSSAKMKPYTTIKTIDSASI